VPHIVKSPDPKFHEMFQEALEKFADTTPAEFFDLFLKQATQFSLKTKEETAFDLQDVVDFYHTHQFLSSARDEKRDKRRQYQD